MSGRTSSHYRVLRKMSRGNTGSFFAEGLSLPFKMYFFFNGRV
jgi:hypothetical protein